MLSGQTAGPLLALEVFLNCKWEKYVVKPLITSKEKVDI